MVRRPRGMWIQPIFFRVGWRDENSPQGDLSTWIEIPINEDAWSNFLHAYQILERTWLEGGMQWHESTQWGQVNQQCETANCRGEKSVTGSSVGLHCYKRQWWELALNHFRFMIIFITMCFSVHECSDVPAKLHDLLSGNSRHVEGILLTAISP